ncbi:MAG: MBL fold metallo-hydrolase [Rhodospirillaceae bacterium]|jgi:ribonuclease Z|nr:MBL fold metallo-hydrolase [Rhodospirillaceae bacterium]MBT4589404.1 MBL fold metallo-hydrolase [Rhodospirillaceae bacterium]MBT4941002.1 MBL fold metallo-hydrolase [Rhodospirillaceae bacterium]MBT5940634.1 MBL fold metallo-hydrolase [Rhodospirillaceae bacterium]MBT7267304.1 MBL fold metallo-hydrolase [Rhodospirillaceae bacterium]
MSEVGNTNATRGTYAEQYYPNTEELGPDEMRVVALGTGRPFLRRSQANASWLVELGNGDKFVFDYGFGSQMNFTALEMPYSDVNAWFCTHLHTDHVGDFAQVWIGSWAGGRLEPLEMYGPSGAEEKYGFQFFAEKQMESYAWDTDTRVGALPAVGAEINIHEFDYSKVHVVYDHNDVKITSFPAVHLTDGAVSLRLDWKGRSFVYSGDTTPSQFFIDNAKGAEVVVHETFNTIEQLMDRSGYDERTARAIGTYIHSAPEEAAVVLKEVDPRLAVIFHFFNDFDTAPEMYEKVRQHYKGPLAMATDMMVVNVTDDQVVTRMTEFSDHVWPNKRKHAGFGKAKRKKMIGMSDWLLEAQIFPKVLTERGYVNKDEV